MATFHQVFSAFYPALALQSPRKLNAYGRRQGFPVALRLDNLQKDGTLILQARFRPEQATPKSWALDPPLQELLRAGQARLGFTRGNAQLSLLRFTKRVKLNEAVPAVDGFLAALTRAGLSAGDTCHYCSSREPAQIVFNGKTVGQICTACQNEQTRVLDEERRWDARSLVPLAAAAAFTIVAVAVLWSLIWVGVDALFRWEHGTMQLPVKLSALVALLLGAGAASPARVIKRVRNRGYWLAGLLGVGCALAGSILGEGLLYVERCWQAGTPEALALAGFMPALWRQMVAGNDLFLILRGVCLTALVVVAWLLAKPAKPRLPL